MIRVLIADDQPIVRDGFRYLVDSTSDMTTCGVAADGAEAVRLAADTRPDVVLMDVRMPKVDGIEATRRICRDPALRGARIVILTTFEHDEYLFDALRAGASGFLVKDIDPDDLLDALRTVVAGDGVIMPRLTGRLIQEFANTRRRAAELPVELTPREREVLALVGRGHTNQEIADELVLSPASAKTYVSRLLLKLNARDRVQLVVLAHSIGLVS
jgi:DNA-binding NarL/FixJ family response regulator